MTTIDRTLAFGLRRVVPEDAEAAWGARLIIDMDGWVDFVGNRAGAFGTDEAKAKLFDLLDERFPIKALRETVSDKIRKYEITTRDNNDVVLFDDDKLTVIGNANASYGYFYVAAFPKPGAL